MTHVFHRQPRHDYPVAVGGEGVEIIDRNGKRYLDACGGAAVSCLGHNHPRVIEAIKAGVNNYVVKPFTPEELGGRIAETLAKRKAG